MVLKLRNTLLNGKPPTWYLPTWPIRLLISQWSWLVVRLILVKQNTQQNPRDLHHNLQLFYDRFSFFLSYLDLLLFRAPIWFLIDLCFFVLTKAKGFIGAQFEVQCRGEQFLLGNWPPAATSHWWVHCSRSQSLAFGISWLGCCGNFSPFPCLIWLNFSVHTCLLSEIGELSWLYHFLFEGALLLIGYNYSSWCLYIIDCF